MEGSKAITRTVETFVIVGKLALEKGGGGYYCLFYFRDVL